MIETARLRLRRHVVSDRAVVARLWSEPAVVRHIGGRPFTAEESWARLLRTIGHWAAFGCGMWAVEERAGGRFLGEAGLADFGRGIAGFEGPIELGYAFLPEAHGRGIAHEATAAILAMADRAPGLAETRCMIDPGNTASIRLAERLGYRAYERVARGHGMVDLYRRPRHGRAAGGGE